MGICFWRPDSESVNSEDVVIFFFCYPSLFAMDLGLVLGPGLSKVLVPRGFVHSSSLSRFRFNGGFWRV